MQAAPVVQSGADALAALGGSQRIAIIGGSSLLRSDLMSALKPLTVETSRGPVVVHEGPHCVFVQRHKTLPSQQYELPHDVRHAAIAEALASLGIRVVVGVGSVGALTASCPPGRAVVPSDYFNLWGIESGLRDEGAHISPQYDASVRALLADVAHVDAAAQVVYVQTRGPRFETPAEVRFLATLGDVVGMTGAHEATHLQERGLRYASLCMVDNWANGLAAVPLTLEQFRALVHTNEHAVERLVQDVLRRFAK